MTSPTRSVAVRLSLDPSSYVAGASRAEASTLSLDKAVSKVGGSTATSMDKAAKGAAGAETAFGKLNKAAGSLGFTLGGLAGVGAAVGAAMSVKWAADYQSALTRLVTTAGESQKNIGLVGKGFLDMAGQVGISADELAKGAYTAESAGYHGADALRVMQAAAQGAKQENADLGKVTDAVSTILHDYHLKASDAATVTSQLITAVSHGKTTFDELTGSLHSVTPLAAKMGLTIADITGTLSAMTASGESADQATQNMANTLQHLASPTQTMINELAQLGISTDDLATSLSKNGLAGTLQMVEEAIVNHLDPATQRVLLPALNQSKTAAQDLQIMIGKMPPTLAKYSKALLDGSMNQQDFRKAAIGLGGQAGVMGDQFLSLYKSSDGFNSVLKAGGPASQVFTAAMQKAFGTTAALNVALQTTGENAAGTNAAIKDIGKASADAQGNIKGWAEVQGNFNQQLAEAEAGVKSLAIEAGQHLLPVLSSALGWVAHDGVPILEHLGSLVGTVGHDFSQLPTPIKDTALALGALAAANKLGLFSALESGAGKVATGLTNMVSGVGRATTSLSGLRSTATGVMNFFGGPVVLGFAAVTTAVAESVHQVDDWSKAIFEGGNAAQKAMDQIAKQEQATLSPGDWWNRAKGLWNDGIAQLQGYSSALDEAQQKAKGMYDRLSPLQQAQHDVTQSQDDLNQAIHDYGKDSQEAKFAAWQHQNALDGVRVQESLMDQATRGTNAALQDQIGLQQQLSQAGVSLDQTQLSAKQAIRDYQKALKDTNLTEDDRALSLDNVAQSMFSVLDAAKKQADAETQGLPAQLQTNQEIVRQRDALDAVVKQLGFVPPALQSMYDQLNGPTAKALEATQTHVNDAGTAMTNVANNDIPGLNTALGTLATAAGTTVPQSITGAFLPVLKTAQDQLNGPTNQAIQGTTAWFDTYMNHLLNYGTKVVDPFQHAIDLTNQALLSVATQSDSTGGHVGLLGQLINGLPTSHDTFITADTRPAQDQINAFLAQVQSQGFLGAVHPYVGSPVGSGAQTGGLIGLPPPPGHAEGGYTGPGAKYTPAGIVHAGEIVWSQADIAAHGGVGTVEAMRRARPGYADGGYVLPDSMIYPVAAGQSLLQHIGQLEQNMMAATMSPYAGMVLGATSQAAVRVGAQMAMARGWTGVQWNDLFNLGMRESGWNPYAVNPSSGAYGIGQSLGHGHPYNLGDIPAQVAWMDDYIAGRYATPANAWAHEVQFGWYDGGGKLQPGATLALNGTGKAETVRTAEQEAAVQAVLRSREFSGGGGSGAPMLSNSTSVTGMVVNGDVYAGDPVELARQAARRTTRLLAAAGI